MADDRRIITGTHVVAKEGSLLEDGTTRKWKMDDTVGKSLGGKSSVNIADTQNFAGGNSWYQGDNKSTALSVDGVTKPTGTTTADTGDVQFLYVRNLDTTLDCHISLTTDQTWNGEWSNGVGSPSTGGTNGQWEDTGYSNRNPSYDGRWDEGMYIIVPPGGSVHLRGDSTGHHNLEHVRFRSSNTQVAINIEYILAE